MILKALAASPEILVVWIEDEYSELSLSYYAPQHYFHKVALAPASRGRYHDVMGEEVVGRQMVWLSLTFDHRLVDGGPAARFLQRVVQLVERPHLLIT